MHGQGDTTVGYTSFFIVPLLIDAILSVYKDIGWDVHSTVSINPPPTYFGSTYVKLSVWPRGHVHLWLADADVIKVGHSCSRLYVPTDRHA